MKVIKSVIFLISALVVIFSFAFAYSKESRQKAYFDSGISFNIPEGWNTLPDDDLKKIKPPKSGKHVAVLHWQSQDKQEISLLVISQVRRESNEEKPLTRLFYEMLNISYLHPKLGFLSNFFEITVSGQKGNRVDFELFSGKDQEKKLRSIVVLEKNKYFFVISFEQKKITQNDQIDFQ